jgi:hypothetical protein
MATKDRVIVVEIKGGRVTRAYTDIRSLAKAEVLVLNRDRDPAGGLFELVGIKCLNAKRMTKRMMASTKGSGDIPSSLEIEAVAGGRSEDELRLQLLEAKARVETLEALCVVAYRELLAAQSEPGFVAPPELLGALYGAGGVHLGEYEEQGDDEDEADVREVHANEDEEDEIW